MDLAFLSPLYARRGPYACVYLDTSRDVDDPERAIALRWRHLRERLTDQGADPATEWALERVVGADRDVPGRHGQAIFAAHGRLALEEELPDPPVRDRAGYSMVPDVMPLALQHAPDIPYAVVDARRASSAPGPGTARPDLQVDLEAGRWPVTRVAGGEHTSWYVPAGEWHLYAARVAGRVTALAEHGRAEVVVVSGDAWARGVLVHQLPRRLHERVVGIESDGRAPQPGRAMLEDELGYLLNGRMAARDRARLDRFLAQPARHRTPMEGLGPVLEALRRGQAEALLINDPADLPARLWVGVAPKQIGVSFDELRAYGVRSCWEVPADAALLRAVVGTGAELVVVPREELPLENGVGALLRYPDGELQG